MAHEDMAAHKEIHMVVYLEIRWRLKMWQFIRRYIDMEVYLERWWRLVRRYIHMAIYLEISDMVYSLQYIYRLYSKW